MFHNTIIYSHIYSKKIIRIGTTIGQKIFIDIYYDFLYSKQNYTIWLQAIKCKIIFLLIFNIKTINLKGSAFIQRSYASTFRNSHLKLEVEVSPFRNTDEPNNMKKGIQEIRYAYNQYLVSFLLLLLLLVIIIILVSYLLVLQFYCHYYHY